MKRLIWQVARIIISVSLIAYIFYKIGLSNLWGALSSAHLGYLIIALLLHLVGLLISAYRWQMLLVGQGIEFSLKDIIAMYLVGLFFNTFLPTSIGGDVVRAYDTARFSRRGAKSVTTVIVERLIGIFSLIAIAGIALLWSSRWLRDIRIAWIILICAVIFILIPFILLNRSISRKVGLLFDLPFLKRVKGKVQQVYEAIDVYRERKDIVAEVLLLSFLLQLNVILYYYVIALSLGINLSFIYFCLFVPVILVISMLPISISGLGIRENAFALFFAPLIQPPEVAFAAAVSLSLLGYIVQVVFNSIGGVVYMLRK